MFRLLIECSKDISKLNIDFTDGTSSIIEKSPKDTPENLPNKQNKDNPPNKGGFLDFSDEVFDNPITSGIVKKPEISLHEREVKVAKELQDFEL